MIALFVLASARAGAAQCPTKDCDLTRLARRTLTAARIVGSPPIIDGRVDDPAWADAEPAVDFIEGTPRPAAPAGLRSEARVLVDSTAIYIAIVYDDPTPDRILAPLTRRDDETTSDWAFVEIDSRHDRRTAFSFGVNPRGVQVDGIWIDDDKTYDTSWNAVWESGGHVNQHGWTAEFRIPFSQLAFNLPEGADDLTWGINFYRYSPSHGESSNWSPRYRGLGGIVSNFNDLHLPAPSHVTRLEMTPYIALRMGSNEPGDGSAGLRAGADFKVGLGSSVSLTGTVLPDFGQIEADPSQVNLSAFELFQAERRPFFIEGLDLFRFDTSLTFSDHDVSFADEAVFYSRRIGRAPRGGAPNGSTLVSSPDVTTLLGAAKLSGQTANNWTMGLFTAFTGAEAAVVRDADGSTGPWPVEPRASVTVGRAVKTLNRGDSTLGVFVADLHRFGLGPLSTLFVRDQAMAGIDALHRFAGHKYDVRGWALLSRTSGDSAAMERLVEAPQHYFQRPDGGHSGLLAETEVSALQGGGAEVSALRGGAGGVRLARIAGAFRWTIDARGVSAGFDQSEMGFQRNADWLLATGRWQYERFRPGKWIRAWTIGSDNAGAGWTWAGEPRARTVNGFVTLDWRNYWTLKTTVSHAWSALSMERLRGGPALLLPPRDTLSLFLQTDQRRGSYVSVDASGSQEPDSGSWSLALSPLLNIRASDHLQWSVGPSYRADVVGWQPIDTQPTTDVARLTQRTLSVTIRGDVTFSPRLVLQVYAQPFGTEGRYDRPQQLLAPRHPDPALRFAPVTAAGLDVPTEDRSLTGNTVLRWEYRPGSFLTLVWSHHRDSDPSTNVLLLKASFRIGA